jgi:lipopolysaccharide heptosyltransferase II
MSGLMGPWAGARRILVVRLDALGDVVMTTPAFRALAQGSGGVHLTLLTSPAGAAVAPLLPEIQDVIAADVPWMKGGAPDGGEATSGPNPRGVGEATRGLVERLRAGDYDGAVIFTVHTQSALPAALTCLMADIPLRLAHARENPYRLLTDWVPEPEPDAPVRHETRRQLDLVAAIGATVEEEHLSIRVPDHAARAVRSRLEALGVTCGRPWAVVAPGASAPSRRYPPERFAAVAEVLVRRHDWRLVVTGTGGEQAIARQVVSGLEPDAVSVAGELDLPELAALLAVAPVVIANNSGTAHFAAAVASPVVDLYALTNLQHAPWGVDARVLAVDVPCKGCRKSVCPFGDAACLTRVEPADVVQAAIDLVTEDRQAAGFPAGILEPNPRGLAARSVRAVRVARDEPARDAPPPSRAPQPGIRPAPSPAADTIAVGGIRR